MQNTLGEDGHHLCAQWLGSCSPEQCARDWLEGSSDGQRPSGFALKFGQSVWNSRVVQRGQPSSSWTATAGSWGSSRFRCGRTLNDLIEQFDNRSIMNVRTGWVHVHGLDNDNVGSAVLPNYDMQSVTEHGPALFRLMSPVIMRKKNPLSKVTAFGDAACLVNHELLYDCMNNNFYSLKV